MTGLAGVAVRVLATRVVDAVMHRGRSLKAELTNTLPGIEDVRDRALLEAICFAVLRARTRSDAALAQWMPRPLGPRDNELKALLHVGFAQLVVLELPAHAAFAGLGRVDLHRLGAVNERDLDELGADSARVCPA